MDEVARAVREITRRQSEWLEAQFEAMASGSTLCVHEDRPDADDLERVTFRMRGHVLAAGDICDESGRKTQFGPKR